MAPIKRRSQARSRRSHPTKLAIWPIKVWVACLRSVWVRRRGERADICTDDGIGQEGRICDMALLNVAKPRCLCPADANERPRPGLASAGGLLRLKKHVNAWQRQHVLLFYVMRWTAVISITDLFSLSRQTSRPPSVRHDAGAGTLSKKENILCLVSKVSSETC